MRVLRLAGLAAAWFESQVEPWVLAAEAEVPTDAREALPDAAAEALAWVAPWVLAEQQALPDAQAEPPAEVRASYPNRGRRWEDCLEDLP